jgi:hypothetical protein
MGCDLLGYAIGIVFTFLAVSFVASAGTEGVSSILNWRANLLLEGIKTLLNDPAFSGLALRVYNHALVNPASTGSVGSGTQFKSKPSYIDPQYFASALMEILEAKKSTLDDVLSSIDRNVQDGQLRELLRGMAIRSDGELNRIRAEIADWFRRAAAEISGAYKRRAMLSSFVFGLVLSALLDVEPLRTASTAGGREGAHWFDMLGGWLITATSTLYGAPFWFDLLQQVIHLRSTGPAPQNQAQIAGQANLSPQSAFQDALRFQQLERQLAVAPVEAARAIASCQNAERELLAELINQLRREDAPTPEEGRQSG